MRLSPPVLGAILLSLACDPPIETESGDPAANEPLRAPPRGMFEPVADVLQTSCGTLDCHGQVGRNLRLYGARGLRLDATANPADGETTPREYDESYWSVVGLEPDVMSLVVADSGRRPQRLLLVRKAIGLEKHKGGSLFSTGDDGYSCLVSWIAGQVDLAACKRQSEIARPQAR